MLGARFFRGADRWGRSTGTERGGFSTNSSMRVGIHQLHYLPWLRYFEKAARCDVFIVLDNIQFTKNGWQNRNKIKSGAGTVILTVPVHTRLGETMDRVCIDNGPPWRRKHWRTIEQSYSKGPFFGDHAAFLEDTYAREWVMLNDLNRHMLVYLLQALGIQTRLVYASELNVPGTATERLINLVKEVGGDRYYSGAYAAEEYLDTELLADAGIALDLQTWHPPIYPQLHGAFVRDLSIVDLLMNCGPDSRSVLLGEEQ